MQRHSRILAAETVGTAILMMGGPGSAIIAGSAIGTLGVALAFGLVALGIWAWAAFLIVAGAYVVFAVLVLGIAYLKLKRLSGLKKTRKTVTEGLEMLRNESQQPDGKRPAIAAR